MYKTTKGGIAYEGKLQPDDEIVFDLNASFAKVKEQQAEIDELVDMLEQSCKYMDKALVDKMKALLAKHRRK